MSVAEHFEHDPEWVIASDEREGDDLNHFWAVRLGPVPDEDGMVWCAVHVTNENSGFGWPVGVTIQPLKHLGDGFYGA